MSALLSAVGIAERALRAIGAFPVTESAADGEQLREALTWLDLIAAQFAGSTKIFRLIPSTVSFTLINGTQTYDLDGALGANLPIDKVQFPVQALLKFSDGRTRELPIVTRDTWNAIEDKTRPGAPEIITIDRAEAPQLKIFPTPASTDPAVYVLQLDVQTYAPNVAPAGVTGTQPQESVRLNFGTAWQRYLIFQLAHDIGSGPITKLPETSLNRFGKTATEAKLELLAYENREHEDTPPVSDAYDSHDYEYGGHYNRHDVGGWRGSSY